MVPLDSSYVGIAVSILGNILISVSLNTQKLAHKRNSEAQNEPRSNSVDSNYRLKNGHKPDSRYRPSERTPLLPQSQRSNSRSSKTRHDLAVYAVEPSKTNDNVPQDEQSSESQGQGIHRLPHPEGIIRDLAESGTELAVQEGSDGRIRRKWLQVRGADGHQDGVFPASADAAPTTPAPKYPRTQSRSSDVNGSISYKRAPKQEQNVFASKLWWLGLCLMALGELGNFTSYAFAPASVVAPLGTVALIANCFIAPLMLHERFRKKDVVGIAFSIVGAVTIVLSSKSENKSLTPHQFIRAVSQPAFFIYAFISLGLIIILLVLSRTRAGDKYLAIDILICALNGGFTVLAVKAFSSFLTQNFVDCFKQWPTYPVLAVLAITAIMQIIFLNKALQRFESRVVVPTQFVSFTISAITGSAILYRDFEDVQIGKVVAFFLGCALVFVGVIFLTSSRFSESEQGSGGDTSQSTIFNVDSDQNDSQISTSSVNSQARLLDGVALTSRPPANVNQELSRSPTGAGRVLRKYNSIGNLPSRTGTSRSGAVATPIRTARPVNLATSKLFSPGYILIAGSGFGNLSDHSSEDGHAEDDEDGELDLESGSRRDSNGSGSSSSDSLKRDGQNTPRRSMAGNSHGQGTSINTQNNDDDDGEDEEYEPMTRSALMRRSGTV